MKITFLGTSAGECYPAVWCHCPNCEYARVHGGRNIRLNSCAVLDDDVLLDMNSNCFSAALRFGVDVTRVTAVLVTHEHQDHFYPQHLVWRGRPSSPNGPQEFDAPVTHIEPYLGHMGGRMGPVPFLRIYGSEKVREAMAANVRIRMAELEEQYRMSFTLVEPGKSFVTAGSLTVTPVLSNHGTPGNTFNYILERNGKTLLYALDTGGYQPEMWDLIASRRYDAVIMEGTFGKHVMDFDYHMNLRKDLAMLNRFTSKGLWKREPRLILSHMAPHWTPPHDLYAPEMEKLGITVAYDGMAAEI